MRFDCGVTVKRAPNSALDASARKPLGVRTRHDAQPRAAGRQRQRLARRVGRGPSPAALPIGSTSPARSARPPNGPMRLTRCVARLPSTAGTSNPPRTARVARAPASRARRSAAARPSGSAKAVSHRRRAMPSTVTSNSAPATAQVSSPVGVELGPEQRDLQRRRRSVVADEPLASRCEYASIGPADRHAAVPGSPSGRGPARSSACPGERTVQRRSSRPPTRKWRRASDRIGSARDRPA